MTTRSPGWIEKQFVEAQKRVNDGPLWVRQVAASDYSASRQIQAESAEETHGPPQRGTERDVGATPEPGFGPGMI
jgi:hypothetical protein